MISSIHCHDNGSVALRAGSLLVVLDVHGRFLACAVYACDQLQGVTAKDDRRLPKASRR